MNEDTIPSYFKYWGKASKDGSSYHLLVYHCLDVAAVGEIILKKNPALLRRISKISGFDIQILKPILLFFLALHDIGKFSESFQFLNKTLCTFLLGIDISLKQPYSKKYGHDSIGWLLWKDYIFKEFIHYIEETRQKKYDHQDWKEIVSWFGEAAFGHHGLPRRTSKNIIRNYFSDADKCASIQYVLEISKLFPIHDLFSIDIEKHYSSLSEKMHEASWLIAGFIVLCDWIGSGPIFQYLPTKKEQPPMSLEKYWNSIALKYAKIAVDQAGVLPCKSNNELDPLEDLLSLPENAKLTPLQELVKSIHISDHPQLFIIEDETGAGKTEASLILLNRLMARGVSNGFYLALPTMATADGIFPRIQKACHNLYLPDERPSLILSHSSARLSEKFTKSIIKPDTEEKEQSYENDAQSECQAWLTDNRKKSLLSHGGVGTIDQTFFAILKTKYQSLRLFGLVGKLLIIDEAHAYDAYMSKELEVLLRVHSAIGGSAIIMSATLPYDTRQKLSNAFLKGLGSPSFVLSEKHAYPLLTTIAHEKQNKREIPFLPPQKTKKRIIHFLNSEEDIDAAIADNIKSGKCVCWIRNSIRDARQAYRRLSLLHKDVKLFHARFTIGDRLGIQAGVLNNFGKLSISEQRKSKLVIATQVVEQSLDLDFDVIISDLAPIDLVLQRAGRLHRHIRDLNGNVKKEGQDERGIAIFYLYTPKFIDNPDLNWFSSYFPNAKKVYENHARLWLGLKQLRQLPEGILPDNIRRLIEKTYDKEALIPPGLRKTDMAAKGTESGHRTFGEINTIKLETGYSMEEQIWPEDSNMPTRLGDETIIITLSKWQNETLLPFNEKGKHSWQNSELRAQKKNIAKIPEYDEVVQNAFDKIKPSLPSKGKWMNILPMVWDMGKNIWRGVVVNRDRREEQVYYDQKQGLFYAYEYEPIQNDDQLETDETI